MLMLSLFLSIRFIWAQPSSDVNEAKRGASEPTAMEILPLWICRLVLGVLLEVAHWRWIYSLVVASRTLLRYQTQISLHLAPSSLIIESMPTNKRRFIHDNDILFEFIPKTWYASQICRLSFGCHHFRLNRIWILVFISTSSHSSALTWARSHSLYSNHAD